MSAWCQQARGASQRQYTNEMVTWLHLGKNEDLDISKGLYLQTGYLMSLFEKWSMCGGHDKADEGGGRMERWEQENATVTKARSGKHFPRIDRSTNECNLDFFWPHLPWPHSESFLSAWHYLPKYCHFPLLTDPTALLNFGGCSQYQTLSHRLRHGNSSSNNKWPRPSLHIKSLLQAFWSRTPWPRPHDSIIYITTLYYQITAAKAAFSQTLTSTPVWVRSTVCPSSFRNAKNNSWKPNTMALQWSTMTHRASLTLPPFPYSSSGTQTWHTSFSCPAQRHSRWSRAPKQAETHSGALNTPSTCRSAPVSRLTSRVCLPYTVLLHRWLAQQGCPSAASQLRLLTQSCVCTQPQAGRVSMSIQVGAYVVRKERQLCVYSILMLTADRLHDANSRCAQSSQTWSSYSYFPRSILLLK